MQKITIWHNPKCSKSREAMKILEECGTENDVVKYLQSQPNREEIANLLQKLNLPARELMRTKEEIYKELNLKEEKSEERLIEAMAQNPKLIERPVLIKGDSAIIGRPTSIIEAFIKA